MNSDENGASQESEGLLKGNFEPQKQVLKDSQVVDPKAQYHKKALESVGGSMVFVEREMLTWDSTKP